MNTDLPIGLALDKIREWGSARNIEPPPIPSNAANLTPWTKSNFLAVVGESDPMDEKQFPSSIALNHATGMAEPLAKKLNCLTRGNHSTNTNTQHNTLSTKTWGGIASIIQLSGNSGQLNTQQ